MIEDLKPYPEYKDSGLPWLGKVPAHWHSRRMKFLFRELSQKGFPNEPLLAATQTKGVVLKEEYVLRTVTAINGLENLKLVEVGDFVISLRSFQGGIEVSHARGIISPAYTVLRPRLGFDSRYFERYFKSSAFISSLSLFVTGIREGQNIDYERLSRAFMPLPPPGEQAAIARFLSWAANRLDRAIWAKRRIIALLQEQKQAIIHRAVTRGLDPSVPLKDSGIPWLGEIPERWEVRRLKDIATVQTGITLGKDYGLASTTLYPYLRVANVQSDRLDLRNVKQVAVPEVDAKRSTLIPGDVLMTEGGDIDKLGRGCLWSGEVASCLHQNHVFAVRCGARLNPGFLVALMGSAHGRSYFQVTAKQTTNLASTNSTTLKAFPLLLPGHQEQQQILSFIDGETGYLCSAITDTEREITLLREYRTRLIADMVTGKLDVREAAARLPEEIEPSIQSDAAGYDGDEAEDDPVSDPIDTEEDCHDS